MNNDQKIKIEICHVCKLEIADYSSYFKNSSYFKASFSQMTSKYYEEKSYLASSIILIVDDVKLVSDRQYI